MDQKHPFFSRYDHGFVRVAASTPRVRTADVAYNRDAIIEEAQRAHDTKTDLLVYPELSLSSYAIDDLVTQSAFLEAVEQAVADIVAASKTLSPVLLVGAPLRHNSRLYNCALVIAAGKLIGIIPKSFIPNHCNSYEKRWFTHGRNVRNTAISIQGMDAPFGSDLVFSSNQLTGFKLFIEIGEDLLSPVQPSTSGVLAGATIVANLAASAAVIGGAEKRHMLCKVQSCRAPSAYIYSSAGYGESTTDLAWDGQAMIYELGNLLAENERFSLSPQLCIADVDTDRITSERLRLSTFNDAAEANGHPENSIRHICFDHQPAQYDTSLIRPVPRFPFVHSQPQKLNDECEEALNIQISSLMRRIKQTDAKSLVIGISGGLDSTQALIVATMACDRLGLPRSTVRGYTMPGFGTSDSTRGNAWKLMKNLQITAEEIDIRPAARRMLEDIGHPFSKGEAIYDATFENVQAGLRTDYLFRLAGQHDGFVLGTGDLSELALGWCTYGVGDQMSHYGINAGVPKTLIKYLVRWAITTKQFSDDANIVLLSILNTEISPELIPASDGRKTQSTEKTIGPYELNDFFLHHIVRFGQRPSKVAFLAWHAWCDVSVGLWPAEFPENAKNEYDLPTIRHWLETFLWRFFAFSQFKRSALPNGPKVSSDAALSPRGDWRAPSDAVADVWLTELNNRLPD